MLGNIHIAYLYTFFLGAPVIVFGLNLHKLQTTYAVGAEPYLLSVGMVPLVLVVHVEVVGIKVRGVVLRISFAIYLLHIIIGLCHLQQQAQLSHVCNKLGIGAIHELYAAHLLECDRGKGAQYVVDCCHKRWQK